MLCNLMIIDELIHCTNCLTDCLTKEQKIIYTWSCKKCVDFSDMASMNNIIIWQNSQLIDDVTFILEL